MHLRMCCFFLVDWKVFRECRVLFTTLILIDWWSHGEWSLLLTSIDKVIDLPNYHLIIPLASLWEIKVKARSSIHVNKIRRVKRWPINCFSYARFLILTTVTSIINIIINEFHCYMLIVFSKDCKAADKRPIFNPSFSAAASYIIVGKLIKKSRITAGDAPYVNQR